MDIKEAFEWTGLCLGLEVKNVPRPSMVFSEELLVVAPLWNLGKKLE